MEALRKEVSVPEMTRYKSRPSRAAWKRYQPKLSVGFSGIQPTCCGACGSRAEKARKHIFGVGW